MQAVGSFILKMWPYEERKNQSLKVLLLICGYVGFSLLGLLLWAACSFFFLDFLETAWS